MPKAKNACKCYPPPFARIPENILRNYVTDFVTRTYCSQSKCSGYSMFLSFIPLWNQLPGPSGIGKGYLITKRQSFVGLGAELRCRESIKTVNSVAPHSTMLWFCLVPPTVYLGGYQKAENYSCWSHTTPYRDKGYVFQLLITLPEHISLSSKHSRKKRSAKRVATYRYIPSSVFVAF